MVCEINKKLRNNYSSLFNREVIERWHIEFGKHLSECDTSYCQKERDEWKKSQPHKLYIK